MAKQLVQISFHHSSSRTPYSFLFEGTKAELVQHTIDTDYGTEVPLPLIQEALDAGDKVIEVQADDEYNEYFWIWNKPGNLGFGPCEEGDTSSSKHFNVWIKATDFVPNEEELAELRKLSKEELVNMLAELKAIQNN
jgi:hypothetical protein